MRAIAPCEPGRQVENLKYVSRQLGHANITITLDTYSHLLKETSNGAMARLAMRITGSVDLATPGSCRRCEAEARAHGFRSAELVATLPGRRPYRMCGFLDRERIEHDPGGGLTIEFVRVAKALL